MAMLIKYSKYPKSLAKRIIQYRLLWPSEQIGRERKRRVVNTHTVQNGPAVVGPCSAPKEELLNEAIKFTVICTRFFSPSHKFV